jgi:hypothetical protein
VNQVPATNSLNWTDVKDSHLGFINLNLKVSIAPSK